MNYSKIISYIYALLAVGYGTYFCITYIYYSEFSIIRGYYYRIGTIGMIKNIECYDNNDCYANIEYTVNNTKYLTSSNISNNLKIGDKIEVRYIPDNPSEALVYGNMHIYAYIYIILTILFIILLWIFLLIIIIFPSIYNKYIFLNYAIFITVIISYVCYLNINNNYYNDLNKYDDYEDYTIGTIKSQDECYNIDDKNEKEKEMCYSNIEYFIDGVKHNVKLLTFFYKVGEEVKVYYNKDNPEAIKIYDKTENERLIKIIIYIIILLLLWICLFYNIPLILN
jgi:ABC-type Na+ efflux pump permease subunit